MIRLVAMLTLVLLTATAVAAPPPKSAASRDRIKGVKVSAARPAAKKRAPSESGGRMRHLPFWVPPGEARVRPSRTLARAWAAPAMLKEAPRMRAAARAAMPRDAETPVPSEGDPDRERIQRLQEALYNVVSGPVLGRMRVGMRVMELASGRLLFGRHGQALMDPASNQKVLATATALLRLGSEWQFRTEIAGPTPDADGVVTGDLVLRGSGDPSLRSGHLDEMAGALAARGITRVHGSVLSDPRRLGSDEAGDTRSPLRVSRSGVEIRVRAGDREGAPPLVSVRPDSEAFFVENRATTVAKGRRRLTVSLATVGSRMRVTVTGRMPQRAPVLVVRRQPPSPALYSAVLLRAALAHAGIDVKGGVGIYTPRKPEPRRTAAIVPRFDVPVPLDPPPQIAVLAVHDSDPIPVLIRRINKDSDNEWAERLLETVGAEIYGGAATPAKGIRALRDAITELGLPASAYIPTNGSGLGHGNRITPQAMADLLRKLFFDPRLGPDILQSLSVGGVDGTIRNRFRGSPAAERVRAKTGTLNGKSCLSGYVGDGSDIIVFSIMVQGLRGRTLGHVRSAQVTAVNAMMRYARGGVGPALGDDPTAPTDFENGDEPPDSETEEPDGAQPPAAAAPPPVAPAPAARTAAAR